MLILISILISVFASRQKLTANNIAKNNYLQRSFLIIIWSAVQVRSSSKYLKFMYILLLYLLIDANFLV